MVRKSSFPVHTKMDAPEPAIGSDPGASSSEL